MKYSINVPLVEPVKGTDDNICRRYQYNFYLIPNDVTFQKVILLDQRTLLDFF